MAGFSKIGLKNLLGKLDVFKKNIRLAFWALLFLLVVFEALTIKNLVYQIIDSYKEPAASAIDKGVRIDFTGYEKAVAKMEVGKDFTVKERVDNNPFGAK